MKVLAICVLTLAACDARHLDLISSIDGDAAATSDGSIPSQALRVNVAIDWAQNTGKQARAEHYGLTLVRGSDPGIAGTNGNATYKANVALMHPGSVRFAGELAEDASRPGGWVIDEASPNARWDKTKIAAAFAGLPPYRPTVAITVARWPSGFASRAEPMDATGAQKFAAFCAELVRIVNVEQSHAVEYFEILNEVEPVYRGQGARLGELVSKVALAMKSVDPSVRVGGTAFLHAYADEIDPFLSAAATTIDFISYHGYATGDVNASLTRVFEAGDAIASQAPRLIQSAGNKMPALLALQTQWGLNWNQDPRAATNAAAVFDALSLIAFARSPVALATGWNEADGWYGKLDADFALRPSAYVFSLFNNHMVGNVVSASISEPTAITAMPVLGPRGPALAIVNRSLEPRAVELMQKSSRLGAGKRYMVDARGLSEVPWDKSANAVVVPGLAVVVIAAQQM